VKYLRFLRVNLFRKKIRTGLTIGSFAIAMLLFGLLVIIRFAFNQGVEVAGADRLIVMNRVTFIEPLPISYMDRIAAMPGVKAVTHATWFGGTYQDPKNFFPQFAVDPESWHEMYPEYVVDDAQWKAFLDDRQSAIAGAGIAKQYGWKIGDRIPIEGTIFPGDWQFNLVGIYTGARPKDDTSQFWFHYDYLNETLKAQGAHTWVDHPGWYVVKLANPDDAVSIVKKIDQTFANSDAETKTDTEQAFAENFAKQAGNIAFILESVGAVVFFTLLLVTGNTMATSVRERTGEFAILKALGFSDRFILFFVLAESISIALIGGVLGIGLAKLSTAFGSPAPSVLPLFYLPTDQVFVGIGVALAVGVVAGLLPALAASRLKVVDALRRI
jgi:putative ABC transport system permease protein